MLWGQGVIVISSPDVQVLPWTSGSELGAGDSDPTGAADGLASGGRREQGLEPKKGAPSVSLFLTTGIFLSGMMGGPTGFVCTASGGLGWPHSRESHSC